MALTYTKDDKLIVTQTVTAVLVSNYVYADLHGQPRPDGPEAFHGPISLEEWDNLLTGQGFQKNEG